MSGIKARKWILRSYFENFPKREDVELVEEDLPALQDGGRCNLAGYSNKFGCWIIK